MKKYYSILMLSLLLNCYKFEESQFDPTGTLSILRTLFSGATGYTNFMINQYSVFRPAGLDVYVSYVRRNFGADDSRSRIDLIIASQNGTIMIPTNVPMVGGQITSMVGYGYTAGNITNKYAILFEVLETTGVHNYYYWVGLSLPGAGTKLTFTQFTPPVPDAPIVGFGPFNVGAVEKLVFCQKSGSTTTCYNTNSDFTNLQTITGPVPTSCTNVYNNSSVGWCADSISGTTYQFYSTNGGIAAFGGPTPIALVSNYKTGAYTNSGPSSFFLSPIGTQSHYLEHGAGTVRITSTYGDLTSMGGLTSPGNSYQQAIALSAISSTDSIYPVRGFVNGSFSYLTFIANAGGNSTPYAFKSSDLGATWTQLSQTSLALPAPGYPFDPVPSQTAALGFYATTTGGDKLHNFVNIEGDGLKHYISTNDGATWTLQETIPLTSE
ncbi:LIC11996 family lipoprotein [Leptospira yasudae]|uniref:LIC11996 family lipoprotein n=1 Tax=Leptospira yasudae TaxID=2202201 RepID=UPI001430A116|nr:hypothetical protein [Leptospira yasudae]